MRQIASDPRCHCVITISGTQTWCMWPEGHGGGFHEGRQMQDDGNEKRIRWHPSDVRCSDRPDMMPMDEMEPMP